MNLDNKEKLEIEKESEINNKKQELQIDKIDKEAQKEDTSVVETGESKQESEHSSDKLDVNSAIEEVKEKLEEDAKQENPSTEYKPAKVPSSIGHQILKTFENLLFIFITILVIAFTIFTITSVNNSTIASGISILGIDVSGLSKEEATRKVTNEVSYSLTKNIVLKHNDFETNITPEQIETSFDIESAINAAFDAGTGSNAFTNSFKKISLLVNPVDIKPSLSINEEQLQTTLNDISTQLPDAVIQSTYYIEDNNLIITSGQSGVVIDADATKEIIVSHLNDLSFVDTPIEVATISQEPETPNLDQIYGEIKKDPVDAYYTTDPYVVYPEQNGLDLAISLDEAKAMLETKQEEYTIPLQTLYPNVTTNMIGMEAFPDLLSSFSTRYATSNKDRTTNLRLAAEKINGTVLLPGETFSYNTVVGERTIAAGYKEAAIYQDGEVVNGLGGGICQISTTLYNAALYANLEIVERRNHQFVPSYADAGRDATVVYGSQDFKFTNSRGYAIKIVCSVSNGVAKFDIYGVREPTDYEVVISSKITNRTSTSLSSVTYKTLKQNGQVVSSDVISRDTYKVH